MQRTLQSERFFLKLSFPRRTQPGSFANLVSSKRFAYLCRRNRKGTSPALFNPWRWVIRNQDLLSLGNFVDLLKGSVSIVLGVGAVWTGPGAKLLVDGIHTFYGTFKRIREKGARLGVEEFAAFRALKAQGAADPEDLERILTAEGLAVGER